MHFKEAIILIIQAHKVIDHIIYMNETRFSILFDFYTLNSFKLIKTVNFYSYFNQIIHKLTTGYKYNFYKIEIIMANH